MHKHTKFVLHKDGDSHHYPSNVIGANFSGGSKIIDFRKIAKLHLPPPKISPALRNILFDSDILNLSDINCSIKYSIY